MSGKLMIYSANPYSYEYIHEIIHSHEDAYQMLYMTEGKGVLLRGNETVELAEKQCLLLFPGETHSWKRSAPPWQTLEIKFGIFDYRLEENLQKHMPSVYTVTKETALVFSLIQSAVAEKGPYALRMASAHQESVIYRILTDVRKEQEENNKVEQTMDFFPSLDESRLGPCTRRVLSFLRPVLVHPGKVLSIPQLAKQVGYNQQYMCSKFSEETGMSITDYFRLMRIEHAGMLLRETDLKIAEVGEILRYGDASSFSEDFKRCWGMTPNEYRKKHKE